MGKKVLVAMSGGVDSSVAAHLLKEQGYDVFGVTMQIWQDDKNENNDGCCGASAVSDARHVAELLDIPFYVFNFKEEFKENVIDYFVEEYVSGRTPNPCIICNKIIKWDMLLKKALSLDADFIATGHYAKIYKENGRHFLRQAKNISKDQTYALYNLTQSQLEKTLMPVGEFSKDEIRNIAKNIGMEIHDKPDSQEICFIPDNDYKSFIKKTLNTLPKIGNFLDVNGKILGKHEGIQSYTIGQRKGLGIAFGKPMYVCNIDVCRNEVVLGDNEDLLKRNFQLKT